MATVEGVLTMRLGAVESGRGGFVQDGSGGIAIYLDAAVVGSWPAGTTVVAPRLDLQPVLAAHIASGRSRRSCAAPSPACLPPRRWRPATPRNRSRAPASRFPARSTAAPDTLTDGLGVTIDDGTGPIRAVIGADALAGQAIASGTLATVTGPLGQRDSSGTGAAGYRVHATRAGEVIATEPTPTPTPTPKPTPTPTRITQPATDGFAHARLTRRLRTPDVTGSTAIAAARAMPIGARVTVTGSSPRRPVGWGRRA